VAFLGFGLVFSYHLLIGHLLGGVFYSVGVILYAAILTVFPAYLVGGARRESLAALLPLALLPAILILGSIMFFLLVPGL
jgi:hypothetical protein